MVRRLLALLAVVSFVWWVVMPPEVSSAPERPSKHISAVWPCEYFKPHPGDDRFFAAWNNESNPYVDTADCAADHPGGGQHIYCVVEWHHHGDGTPINPPGWTWQSGWC